MSSNKKIIKQAGKTAQHAHQDTPKSGKRRVSKASRKINKALTKELD